MVEERINRSRKTRNSFPAKILIYRDGLSEAQFRMYRNKELPQIRAAVTQAFQDFPKPQIILIYVVKRHHPRFFVPGGSNVNDKQPLLDTKGNPKPDCLFKDSITYGRAGTSS
jgi:eukaryotic translation initiation factor 2C